MIKCWTSTALHSDMIAFCKNHKPPKTALLQQHRVKKVFFNQLNAAPTRVIISLDWINQNRIFFYFWPREICDTSKPRKSQSRAYCGSKLRNTFCVRWWRCRIEEQVHQHFYARGRFRRREARRSLVISTERQFIIARSRRKWEPRVARWWRQITCFHQMNLIRYLK